MRNAKCGNTPTDQQKNVYICTLKPENDPENRGVAQLASVLAWGARGRKFESSRPDESKTGKFAGFCVSGKLSTCPQVEMKYKNRGEVSNFDSASLAKY